MDQEFDTGEIITTLEFNADPVNTQDLANITHYKLFELFKATINQLVSDT